MSFDLGVWAWAGALSLQEADKLYGRICEGEDLEQRDSPALREFYSKLTARYPELDSCSAAERDRSPWSCALAFSGWNVVMRIGWSSAKEVSGFVHRLAATHGLYCYDPQVPRLRPPPGLPVLRTENGDLSTMPSAEVIERSIRSLRHGSNGFAILETDEQWYIQSAISEDGSYLVEVRDGGPTQHFATDGVTLDGAIRLFQTFAEHVDSWKTAVRWKRLSFPERPPGQFE